MLSIDKDTAVTIIAELFLVASVLSLLSGGNETDNRNRSMLRSMLSIEKDTAAIIIAELFLIASVLFYMIPMNPTNTKGYFSGYEQGLLITGSVLFSISTLIDEFFIEWYYSINIIHGIMGLFFILSSIFITKCDFNADVDEVGFVTCGREMGLLTFFAMGGVFYYTMVAVGEYQKQKKVVPSMLSFVLKAIASILFMTGGFVQMCSDGDDFSVFRDLMFSGCIFHTVASIGLIVSKFMNQAE